jgi:multiple sugar transport system permease protein
LDKEGIAMSKTMEELYSPLVKGKQKAAARNWNSSKLWRKLKPYLYLLPAAILLGIWMYKP